MLLLLVSATSFEIRETTQWLENLPIPHNIPETNLLITGIGQLQTSYALQKKIADRKPDLVIQAGFGGSPDPDDSGKVYAIRSERIADLGVMDASGFRNIFEMGLADPDQFPFRQGKLHNPYHKLLDWTCLPLIDGITVNEIKSAEFVGFQRNNLPVVESMEGAALHFVCLMENIPFLQIRAVSNVLGERDKRQWKLKEAGQSLDNSLISLVHKLEKANETLFGI